MLADDALDEGRTYSAIRAGDAEIRALAALASMGVKHEGALVDAEAFRAVAAATFRAARKDEAVAEVVARELDRADRPVYARDLREQHQPTKEIEK